ncbi:MAG: hypothetical protein AAGA03_04890 [Planctomycetota bacterium]
MADDQVEVQNVNVPGHTSNVNAEKYAAMRKVLLSVLPTADPGLTQAEMKQAIQPHLPQELWPEGNKSGWWMKTVQLDLEAKGMVVRDTTAKPLRWRRKASD